MFRHRALCVLAAAAAVCGSTFVIGGSAGALASAPARQSGAAGAVSSNFALAVGPADLTSATAGGGCQLGNGVQHVFYVGFDNFHLRRDDDNSIANDGDENLNSDTNVPSDLEQVPALYNFIRGTSNAGTTGTYDSSNYADGRNTTYTDGTTYAGGTLLANQHTPLIAHTSVDFTTSYSGLYGDRNGIATSQNSEAAYTNALTSGDDNLPVGYSSGFSYWTDPVNTSYIPGDNTTVITTPSGNGAVNPPAPWEPFTEAGCDVGAVAATGLTLENSSSVSDESTSSVKFTTADEGLAIHCANPTIDPSTICAEPGVTSVPDTLPGDPSYTGYSAVFGHRFIAPALNGRISGAGTASGQSATLSLLPGRPTTSSFPGFNGEDGNYTLGYMLDMEKAGVPVTFGYLSDAHDCHNTLYADYDDTGVAGSKTQSECNYTDAPGSTDPLYKGSPNYQAFGTGEAGYEDYLKQLNSDFQSFFDTAKSDGYTTSNTEFVFYSDEQDAVSEGTPANPTCDGVTTPCEWNHSGVNETSDEAGTATNQVPGQLGEVFVDLDATLPTESKYANQPYFINPDSAPELYLENGTGANPALGTPAQTAPNVRQFERDVAGASYTDPYTGAAAPIVDYAADQRELTALHMVTADPLRTPTEVVFSPPPDFVNSVPAANASNSSASAVVSDGTSGTGGSSGSVGCAGLGEATTPSACSQSSYVYVHGDFAPQVDDTWAGFVGPGVQNLGQTTATWTDETDLRPTLLALVGLHDSYTDDGRVVTQLISPSAESSDPEITAALMSPDATALGTLLKKLSAPVYMSSEGANDGFGPATLVADSDALASGSSSSDTLYTTVEADISHITAERNAVVSDIQSQLMAAELNGTPTNGATDETEGACILQYANTLKAYAASGGTSAPPVDCGVSVGAVLPEASHPALFIILGGVLAAGMLLLMGRRRRRTAPVTA